MISVSEAFAALGRLPPAPVSLTSDEERSVAKLEAAVDVVIGDRGKFSGEPFRLQFNEVIPPKVAQALQWKYVRGGWRVVFQPHPTGVFISFVPVEADAPATTSKSLPSVASSIASSAVTNAQPAGKRLLVRMPTRGRPAQALSVLEKYRDMAGCSIAIEVMIDEDDGSMMAASVLQRLNALGCTVTVGRHKSKIEAVNGGRVSEWDVLLLASDDMVPREQNYAVEILRAMEEHWPHLDGAIYMDDGYQGAKCCTLPIMGKRWWEQVGKIVYAREYRSLCSDVEQTELWTAMGRLAYVPKRLIEHCHPAAGFKTDELYARNDALHAADMEVYNWRKNLCHPRAQWGFAAPPLWLSICIATIPARRDRLERLLDHLWYQILGLKQPREVEVIVDSGNGSIGQKRQRMLERAKGHFVCSVDDDDSVAHNYVSRIVHSLKDNPTTDSVRLCGVMTTAGSVPEPFENSLKHREWSDKDGKHFRQPTHLSPVRRELALKVGFVDVSYGEDFDYSLRLYPLLKTEADAGDEPLYFYFYWPTKSGGE